MRTFQLHRDTDVSGVSGTGVVADGVVFPDGTTVIRWRTLPHSSTVVWDDLDAAVAVHGHAGATRFVFGGEPVQQSPEEIERYIRQLRDRAHELGRRLQGES